MDTVKKIKTTIDKLDGDFKNSITNNTLNINVIEGLAENSIEECKKIINNHIEKIIISEIDEKDLIVKKNKNGNN